MKIKAIARCILLNSLMLPFALGATETCPQPVAKITSAQGQVDVQAGGAVGSSWQGVHTGDPLCPGDILRTAKWSRATLSLSSGAVLTVDQNTTMSFSAPTQASSWFLNLMEGMTFFRSRQPQRLDVHTPFINAVHEGTEFTVAVTKQQAEITVLDGVVNATNSAGTIKINQGQQGIAQAGQPPRVQALKITPQDAVQWSLYYPPIIDSSQGIAKQGNYKQDSISTDSQLNSALIAYRQGNSHLALTKLEQIPASQQDAHYLTLKAALLLTVGRLDQAQPLIQQAQGLQPNNSDAYALQAIIAVAKNQQQSALELANKAVAANQQSPVAKIAQSYAYQSQFKLELALSATQEATQLNPDNALAWARLSELQLSQGDHDQALKSAQKAQALNPKLARTQTILGFADLAQTDIEPAKQAFEQALTLDSSDPLARLGLGLAKIRQGDLEDGKNELETAVNLDPNNAVIRSYLGKAYYELRDKDFASKEYDIAKAMDPKDPTPYFYDAILKQTTNRPIEALHDMQKAIELNDNRGVYRSRLLLDKDLAARSAAQGRIYSDLGFQQLGLVEGWKSVNAEPSDFSGHRLLADSYSVRPLYEVARVSELLQSQLLQPLSITPVQPQLGEKNLFALQGAGPGTLSYNEFNPLFRKDGFALQTSGLLGSNDTYGNEVTHSGLWRNISYSVGQYHYENGGFRPNNDAHIDLVTGFIQASITPNLSIQGEIRHKETDRGDIDLNADRSFDPSFRIGTNRNIYRAGLHYKFENGSDLIASYLHLDGVDKQGDGNNFDTNGNQGEVQHLFRSKYFSTATGFGVAQSGFINVIDPNKTETKSTHTNGYVYTYTHYPRNIDWTLGLSIDSYESSNPTITQVNPKAGLIWRATNGTTLRAAVSRTLKRSLLTNQTIEPTQIAGFNQFFR